MVRLKRGQSLDEATTILRTLQSGIREATLPPPRPGATLDEYLSEPLMVVSAAAGQSGLRDDVHAAAARDPGRGRPRAADRLRQHRQSPARARHGSRPRMERTPRARRLARASGAPAADREPAARSHGRGRRIDRRAMGQPAPGLAALHGCRLSRAAARLARARVHLGVSRSSRRSSSAWRRRCARPAALPSTR